MEAEGAPAPRIVWLRRLALTCVAVTFMLMVLGAWVKATGSGLACPDWPACYGEYFPPFPSAENGGAWDTNGDGIKEPVPYTQAQQMYEWGHRAVVALLVVPLLAFAIVASAKGLHPGLRALPWTAVGLYLFQAFLGAVTVLVGNRDWATTAHLATAVVFFAVQVVAACLAYLRPWAEASPAGGSGFRTPRTVATLKASGAAPTSTPAVVQAPVTTRRGFVWENPDVVPARRADEGRDGQ